jgi:hypothetical protein
LQVWPPLQIVPHWPQFWGSLAGSVHWPPQRACPPAQLHCPAAQLWPALQAAPQLPQCPTLLVKSTQSKPHWVWPAAHVPLHSPEEQT